MHDLSTTIVGIATPPGRGGIGCVRISGSRSREIAQSLFRPSSPSVSPRDRHTIFGRLLGRDGTAVDLGYLVLFPEGKSYTGEPTAELWLHGSPAILDEAVRTALSRGAVEAEPGEFTYRALRSGRLDLPRAEAIRDLVSARTLYQARVAFAQAEGALSSRIGVLKEDLSDVIARGQAAVEFVEESDVHLPRSELRGGIERLLEEAAALLSGFERGRVVREGATIVLAGSPNVGKSSLFNRMLERERAIVSPEPGTTRDTLEETVDLDGIPVRLIDTAGLRDIADPVENEGVRRARRAREQADIVLLVLDASRPLTEAESVAVKRAGAATERAIVVWNKSDLVAEGGAPSELEGSVPVSALTGTGIEQLMDRLWRDLAGGGTLESAIVTDARHARALEGTIEALAHARTGCVAGLPEELLVEDLKAAMRELGAITGDLANDDLYDRIFRTFCIGK